MWRPRDRERYIGSYDPEHEMPDPDRGPGDRWQSDAYRRTARDTRFAYRMNPNRFEERFEGPRRDIDRDYDTRWNRDARDLDRGGYGGHRDYYGRDYDRGYADRGYFSGRDYDRGSYDRGGHFDRDRIYGSDRGWDYDRDDYFESRFGDRDRWDRDRWDERWRRRY